MAAPLRATTAKVRVPAAGARLAALLRGLGEDGGEPWRPQGFLGRCTHDLEVRLAGTLGFPGGPAYFHGDFLAGGMFALQHLAAEVLPTEQGRCQQGEAAVAASDPAGIVDPALRGSFGEALSSLEAEGLELCWDVEEVKVAALGGLHFVFGARRADAAATGDERPAFRSRCLGDHSAVLRGSERRATVAQLLASCAEGGATLCADVLLAAKQTVILRSKSDGEILAATFDEAARHCLRLEAELVPSGGAQAKTSAAGWGAGGLALWGRRPRFDEDRGWVVSDLNLGLGGNNFADRFPEAA